MSRRVVPLTILFFWLVSGLGSPTMTATAAAFTTATFPSSDHDYDGLTDDIETSGWWNATGFFTTDPLDPDSDDDGLTDGQEKLYDTNPLDDRSPGIYVEYENHLKTRQYFSKDPHSAQPWGWQQHGDRFISLNAVVVRRGATFSVGGPADATIKIVKSRSSLTTLTPVRDACSGRWRVSVPSRGTVGEYQVTLREDDWSKSLNLYVIFELPTPTSSFTQAMIDAFLYDDDPDDLRDEMGINLGTREYTRADKPWIPYGAWVAAGYGYRFELQPFEPFVFEEHVIGTINGRKSQWSAAEALVAHTDKVTRFNYPRWLDSSWKVLRQNPGLGNQCSNIAGLLTAFERSAGIPARPFFVDWRHASFDHATEIWLSGTWYAARGYNSGVEPEGCLPNCGYGYKEPQSRYSWGYNPWHSGGGGSGNVVAAADENWVWGELNPLASQWEHEYRWPSWDWDAIVRKNWFDTLFVPYWRRFGWTREPRITGTPPGAWPAVTGLTMAVDEMAGQSQPGLIVRGVKDYGLDLDGDGYFDQLVIEIEVNAPQPGTYWFQADLGVDRQVPTLVWTGGLIAVAVVRADLAEGTNTVQLVFDGLPIFASKVDGPYVLEYLSITDVDNPTPEDFANLGLGYWSSLYITADYRAYDFQNQGAALSGRVTEQGLDGDGDGLYESLTLNVSLDLFEPGAYMVQGDLYDGRGRFVARATWTGTGSTASLQFSELPGTMGPYTLKDVYLLNAEGEIIDSLIEEYTTQQVMEAEGKTHIMDEADLGEMGAQAILPGPYSDSGVDLDGDGLYDLLVIEVQVEVEEAGQYRLEGWLEGQDGSLISWASSDPLSLAVGVHSLSLPFSGPAIHAHKTDGPFTLMALKLLKGDAYEVLDEVDIAYTTSVYTHDQFKSLPYLELPADHVILFEDHLENGEGHWTADWPWALITAQSHSPSHSWTDSPDGKYANHRNVSLTTVPINLGEFSRPTLQFQTCYDLETDYDYGHVEISTDDGVTWTDVASYTGRTGHWSGELVDLGVIFGAETLRVRFRLDTDAGVTVDGWYIDDVAVYFDDDLDDDGIPNDVEVGEDLANPVDTDGDGIPDYLDPAIRYYFPLIFK
jgi:hypothetical protein